MRSSICSETGAACILALPQKSRPSQMGAFVPLGMVCDIQGEVADWSIAAVLKTAEPQGSGGSNPSLSASSLLRSNEWHGVWSSGKCALAEG